MSILQDLIAELCPTGFPITTLGDRRVAQYATGKQLNRSTLSPDGAYEVFNGGIDASGRHSEFNTSGPAIIVSQGGASAGFVNFVREPFWAGAHCYVVTPGNDVNQRYLFHVLKSRQAQIQASAQGAGIPGLSRGALGATPIPVPPLKVQLEIVRILDQFTQLEAELGTELEARARQYEYYRQEVLQPGADTRWSTLGAVSAKVSSGGTPSSGRDSYYGGDIPWLRTQEVDFGPVTSTGMTITDEGLRNSSAKWIPSHCVIVAMYGATAAKVAINEIPLTTNQACCNLQIDPEQADYRYVFYWVASQYERLKSLGEGSQSNLNAKKVKDFPIPVPSLGKQRQIVASLEKFDALVNDISVGLPAELTARRKQYEYYRDKLLTFEQATV